MSNSIFNLKNNIVLFTGGYGHLGSAAVNALNQHGAKVCVLGRDRQKFNDTFASKKSIDFISVDISSSEEIGLAFNEIFNTYKRIDTLINNAFYLKGQSPEKMSDEEFAYGLDGTLGSVFRCIREIIPYYKRQKHGKIINVSSMYGMIAPDFEIYNNSPQFLNPPHYGASKAGLNQLTKYYASYLGVHGIQVNSISPGPFPSSDVQKDIDFINKLKEKTLLNRIGQPEDLAGAFIFLSSRASDYITGQNIIVDGGWTVR